MKKINILKIIIFALCFVAFIGLFLPYEKSIGEYRKILKENPTSMNLEEVNFKNKDVVDISIIENLKLYSYAVNNSSGNDWLKGEAIINLIISTLLIVSIILINLFEVLNKHILTIIFSILMGLSSILMNYDIVDRGVIPSVNYTYGLSFYLYIPLAIIICLLIPISNYKIQKKKAINK